MRILYAIKDTVANDLVGFTHAIMSFPNDNAAIRAFGEIATNPNSLVAKNIRDYELIALGQCDEDTAWELVPGQRTVLTGKTWLSAQPQGDQQ